MEYELPEFFCRLEDRLYLKVAHFYSSEHKALLRIRKCGIWIAGHNPNFITWVVGGSISYSIAVVRRAFNPIIRHTLPGEQIKSSAIFSVPSSASKASAPSAGLLQLRQMYPAILHLKALLSLLQSDTHSIHRLIRLAIIRRKAAAIVGFVIAPIARPAAIIIARLVWDFHSL